MLVFWGVNVGKYTSPMDPLGIILSTFFNFGSIFCCCSRDRGAMWTQGPLRDGRGCFIFRADIESGPRIAGRLPTLENMNKPNLLLCGEWVHCCFSKLQQLSTYPSVGTVFSCFAKQSPYTVHLFIYIYVFISNKQTLRTKKMNLCIYIYNYST